MNLLNPVPPGQAAVTTRIRGYKSRLTYDPGSYIGSYIYFRGVFEEQIAAAISKVVRPGMTFVDIGANIGQHTCIGAELVGADGRVIAIEPQASVREKLKANISANGYSNVTVVPYAIGRVAHSARLYHLYSSNDGAATLDPVEGAESEEVKVVPMQDVAEQFGIAKADVVKIDVEGAEYDVLCGAEAFFDKNPPAAMFIECMDEYLQRFGHRSTDVIKWLHDRNYRVMALIRGRWRPVPAGVRVSADLAAYR